MLKKSGRAPTNEYLDGTGKLQWGSEKLMAISVDMCLADLRKVFVEREHVLRRTYL